MGFFKNLREDKRRMPGGDLHVPGTGGFSPRTPIRDATVGVVTDKIVNHPVVQGTSSAIDRVRKVPCGFCGKENRGKVYCNKRCETRAAIKKESEPQHTCVSRGKNIRDRTRAKCPVCVEDQNNK